MTKKELSQLRWLNQEICREKQRLAELTDAATRTTAGTVTGLPHLSVAGNKTAIAAAIADTRDVIAEKVARAVREYERLNRYIADVPDSQIRQILCLRYVDGLSWTAVAMRIGGGNTPEGIQMEVARYLSREKRRTRP